MGVPHSVLKYPSVSMKHVQNTQYFFRAIKLIIVYSLSTYLT